MNKGSFTAMIGLIVLVLLSNAIIQMQATQQTEKTGNITGLLNELPLLVQRINWVVDKRISDDLADYAFNNACSMSGFSTNSISGDLISFVQGIEKPSGISCNLVGFFSSNPSGSLVISTYSIKCDATASNGSISFSQAFSSKKQIDLVAGSCTATVKDLVSDIVEVQKTA